MVRDKLCIMSEHATYKAGSNVVVVRGNKVLLGRRKGGKQSNGFWGLPGGHLEWGEKMEDAALRELKEETGLIATKATFYNLTNDIRIYGDETEHRIQVGFMVTDAVGEPQLCEPESCSEWQWFSVDALPWNEIFSPFAKQLKAYMDKQTFVDGSNL